MATYGWMGKILRINLTNGTSTTQDSTPYQDFVGGMGMGYKIIFDEVPLETHPFDPAAKVVIAVGPMTGSGIPCSGRTSIAMLSSWSRGYSIVTGHMGGHFGHAMKYAGYDAIVLEGKAANPCYIAIDDDKVSIEPAGDFWGKGTFATNKGLIDKHGPEFTSLAIGQAGENLVPMSTVNTSWGNSAGAGAGAAIGSKNVKAVVVRGTGGVQIADPEKLMELNNYMLTELIGSNNNHSCPTYPQSWAEYSAQPANRWRGGPGKYWTLAPGGPIDTGEQPHWDINKIGYRCFKGIQDVGEIAQKFTVKVGGCSSCPIRCYNQYYSPELEKFELSVQGSNTCLGRSGASSFYQGGGRLSDLVYTGDRSIAYSPGSAFLMDDYGIWCNYGSIGRDWGILYNQGIAEKNVPAAEWSTVPLDKMLSGDPEWMKYICDIIAYKKGELGETLGLGSYLIAERWDIDRDWWYNNETDGQNSAGGSRLSRNGYPIHHGPGSQVEALYNNLYNRDCMIHELTNTTGCGLPRDIFVGVVNSFFGEGALDAVSNTRIPVNEAKIKYAKFCFLDKQLHDSFTLCNWVWPMVMSPSKERGYKGDIELEAKYMTAITGKTWTDDDVRFACERISHELRVMTAISFKIHENSNNLRKDHDVLMRQYYLREGEVAFSQGVSRLDRADMEKAFDMFYEAMGWDVATGIPTRATLEKFGLKAEADALEKYGILPA